MVSAVATIMGKIFAVGGDKEILQLSDSKTRVVNLHGATVLPGFIDSHTHLYSYGLSFQLIDFRKFRTLNSALRAVKRKAETLKRGEWLLGRGWDKNNWSLDDFPHKSDLDAICKNPCAFSSHDGHSIWVNSSALKLANINNSTHNPRGGVIKKDADGEPSGILFEEAVGLIENAIPQRTFSNKMKALLIAQKNAFKVGVTSVCDFDEDKDKYRMLETASLSGKLKLKVLCGVRREDFDNEDIKGFISGFGNEKLRIGHLKLFADGALGSQTAEMFEPYSGSKNYGVGVLSEKELKKYFRKAAEMGLSVAVHSIGDKANHKVIRAFLSISVKYGNNIPNRIEHLQLIRDEDIPLLKSSGIIASMQPSHILADRDTADKYWGERSKGAYPFKSLIKNGITICFGSDAPIEDMNPLEGIYAAVNRHRPGDGRGAWYPDERLSIREAVEGFTVNAARGVGAESSLGKLKPGYMADMVILSDDIFKRDKTDLHLITVLATISDGYFRYDKGGF